MKIDAKQFFIVLLFLPLLVSAEIRLPRVFGDGMVLQRDQLVTLWGWSTPGAEIEVTFKTKHKTTADQDGQWKVQLKPTSAGGPHAIKISGDGSEISLNDVLFGDVWLCTGQSNMVHAFDRYTTIYPEEIANSTNEQIRQYLVPTSTNLVGPQEDLSGGEWKSANPENLSRFTVVGYFMAKQLHAEYGVPIGLINASVGGTPIEAWMSKAGFADFDQILEQIEENEDTAMVNRVNREAAEVRRAQYAELPADQGLISATKWYEPSLDVSDWKSMFIPGYWEDQGIRTLDGVVWFRKEISIPKSMTQTDAFLEMGRIIDADEFYINGQKVGNTTYQYPPRRYTIPQGVLNEGKNVLAIRVTNNYGKGGFVPDKPYYLRANNEEIDLKGEWQYQVGAVYDRRKAKFPRSISIQNQPTALFNAMVAPYTDLRVKGICWYQGESNAGRPEEYAELLPAYINDYRKQFEQPDMPVIVIQLPNYLDVNYLPEESSWAEMREAQAEVTELAHADYVVTIDLGEWNDIHPMRKKPVGERAALVARHLVYGEKDLVYSGPRLIDYEEKDSKVTLTFDQVGNGLVAKGGSDLRHFAIAGEDGHFVWATAEIQGNQVVVWNDSIEEPMYLRYAWADNPDFANLYNEEGLPAAPFRIELDK